MTPKNSTYFPAYGASYAGPAVEESVQRSGSGNACAEETSSGNDGINYQLLAEHITDRSLVEDCRSFLHASNSYTACSVAPALSIPTRRGLLATTNLQWRCVSDQSADGESPSCTSPVGGITSQDQQSFDGATPIAAEAAVETKETIIDQDRAGLLRGRPDARLEELIRCFTKSYSAIEKELWEQLEEEKQWRAPSATTQSDRPTTVGDYHLISTTAALAGLRCSYLALDKKVQDSCTLLKQLSKERTKEAGLQVAESAVKPQCLHYARRCFVQFSCCRAYYSCHRCHNNSGQCANTSAKAWHATHLKCSVCNVEQEVNEDSHHCSACQTKFAEYFCSQCKHFSSAQTKPYHCGKCGICRKSQDKSFHCDVCNVCMDHKYFGSHKCRPDSGHDICGICQEDTFSACQILPCSHRIHRECVIVLVNNGTRSCPVCRYPLYTSIHG